MSFLGKKFQIKSESEDQTYDHSLSTEKFNTCTEHLIIFTVVSGGDPIGDGDESGYFGGED